MQDCPVTEHSIKLAELEASAKSAHKRIDNIDRLVETFQSMNTSVMLIAHETKNQGEQLSKIVCNMEKQGVQIDIIENRVIAVESKPGQEAAETLKKIKWLLITLIISAVFGVLWKLGT
jgi:hypothetical protein